MRFTRLVKTTRWLLALLLVGFVTAQGACELPPCPAGTVGPYDNREGQVDPDNDADYFCFKAGSSYPPPEPPKLGEYISVYNRDSPGPRDRNAVANSAIIVESCIHDLLIPEFNVNARIDALYNVVMNSPIEQSLGRRTECLSNAEAGTGCDRLRNCLGIAITLDEPSFTEGCTGDTAMRRRISSSGTIYNDWFYCLGLYTGRGNLYCYSAPSPHCDMYRNPCNPDEFPTCEGSRPNTCQYSPEEGESFWYFPGPPCANDTMCVIEGKSALCTGTGPSCSATFATPADVHLDYRAGIACEDAGTLRACVNGHEQLIDCKTLGQGFSCIDGSRPHCGVDFQCDYEGKYPVPTCDGTKITVCNAGRPQTIDCRSLGFETCDPERGVCMNKPVNAQN